MVLKETTAVFLGFGSNRNITGIRVVRLRPYSSRFIHDRSFCRVPRTFGRWVEVRGPCARVVSPFSSTELNIRHSPSSPQRFRTLRTVPNGGSRRLRPSRQGAEGSSETRDRPVEAPRTIPLLGPNADRWSFDPTFQMPGRTRGEDPLETTTRGAGLRGGREKDYLGARDKAVELVSRRWKCRFGSGVGILSAMACVMAERRTFFLALALVFQTNEASEAPESGNTWS